MFTKLFMRDAVERAISTAAQVFLAVGGADAVNYLNIDLKALLLVSSLGGFLSLVKAVAAFKFTDGNSASLTVDLKAKKKK